jgi:2-amino-4-hydroxy-6-hydroxymethyldihydropteridine diphosphokinase
MDWADRRKAIMMTVHWAFISVGSNLGDRLRNCCRGIAALCADASVRLVARSPFYETEPVDYTDQEWFLNTAVKIETDLAPLELLARALAVQKELGRSDGGIRFGPRVLDLDIIFYDHLILETPQLTIPHPRMHKRRFVLQPICDIDGSVVHPILGQDVKRILNQMTDKGQNIRRCSYDC